MSSRPTKVHALANCRDCKWSEEDYETAVRKGREHANKTGHTVDIETGYVWTLNDNSKEAADGKR